MKIIKNTGSNDNKKFSNDFEKYHYYEYKNRLEKDLNGGRKWHIKRIGLEEGMKEYVRMYRHCYFDIIMELYSEPFDTEHEAQHFRDCLEDHLPLYPEVREENGKYIVYSGLVYPSILISYIHDLDKYVNGKLTCPLYYLFANWS